MSLLITKQIDFVQDVAKLIGFIFKTRYFCTFGETFRTQEQAKIFAKSGKGIKNSQHCKRLAIDLNLFSSEKKYLTKTSDYKFLGEYWESLREGNRWGGRFNDGNHFERV